MNEHQPSPVASEASSSESKTTEHKSQNPYALRQSLNSPFDVRSAALTGLFIMATLYTCYFVRDLLLPITLAFLLYLLLRPLLSVFRKCRIPDALSAAVILAVLVAALGYGLYSLSEPAGEWMKKLPQNSRQIEKRLRKVIQPMQKIREAADDLDELTGDVTGETKSTPKVELQGNGLRDILFNRSRNLLFGILIVVVLLYFLLVSGDLCVEKVVKVLPTTKDKQRVTSIAREVERNISRYLLTITLINFLLGGTAYLFLTSMGMPNPILFGVLVGVFNFVPVLGAFVSSTVIALVAVLTFDEVTTALSIPSFVLLVNTLEGNLFTPHILGRQLALNPVVIFLTLLFLTWLWGIGGAFLAVPLLATFKIVCDHTVRFAWVGEILGH